jgi:hypothetical protein
MKITLGDCRQAARAKGGRCLSTKYENSKTKMEWECKLGHRWSARFADIKTQGSWCRMCAGKTPLSLKDGLQGVGRGQGGPLTAHQIREW